MPRILPTFGPAAGSLFGPEIVTRSFCLSFFVLVATVCCCAEPSLADEKLDFFEKRIRPVLVKHCYECHAGDADVIQAGLRLDHRQAMMDGGDSGAVIVPGQPSDSLLVQSLRYEASEMPPDGPLDPKVIRDFEKWINDGAMAPALKPDAAVPNHSWQKSEPFDWQKAKSFWAFQPPTDHALPEVSSPNWAASSIDRFVLAGLDAAGLQPAQTAKRSVLARRVSFDLTGLPPTPDEVAAFVADENPNAYQRYVDRLLASPAQAERWTRVWLDVARYAEDQAHIVGNNGSLTYPNAYRYRDWVVNALANDMPYDQFVRLQLAADQVEPDNHDAHLALGFLGLGPKYYRRNSPEVMADEWEDRVDTVTRGLLGLTVACARCHDHKYDPVPTADYYALAGVFASTEMYNRPLNDQVESKNGEAKKPQDAVHIVREGKPRDLNVMIRGDVSKQGELAPRAFLKVLSSSSDPHPLDTGSGRIDLANAITDRHNPLAARVIVNRVWRQLMGRGLVETPSNFGSLGERPSHPKLLDHLSVRFMDSGWSLKWLQREIVLSSTYRQSSVADQSTVAADPANRLYGRMTRRRLSIESYRDALLSIAGRLDRQFGGQSIDPADENQSRRTVYSEISRLELNALLARFDFPDPNAHSAKRVETNTPLQKLFLLNSPFWVHQARAAAERLTAEHPSRIDRMRHAYRLCYGREPDDREIQRGEAFLTEVSQESSSPEAWTQYVQALLIANEMFLLD